MHTLTPSTPLTESTTFDRLWLQTVSITCNIKGKSSIVATFNPYNGDTTTDDTKILIINDIFEKLSTDVQFAAAVDVILVELERQAKLAGVI